MKMQMKVVMLAVLMLGTFLFSAPAQAQAARDGGSLGVGFGASTVVAGLSMKKMMGDSMAFQGVLGTSRGWGYGTHFGFRANNIGVAGDFLLEQAPLVSSELLSLGWNYGIGAGVAVGGDIDLGVSGVLGLEFNFVPAPLDLVLEYRPGIYFEAGPDEGDIGIALIDFTAHIRFWF